MIPSYTQNKPKKWPSLKQWTRLPKILSKNERISLLILILIFFASSISLIIDFYKNNTILIPTDGGQYTEGIIGQPRFINPILSQTSDVDRDLTQLIFSGIFKYDNFGKLEKDLAEDYKVEDNKIYTVTLKSGVKWQDGETFSADDVIFTFGLIQNPDYKSPLKPNWQGVKIEKIDDRTVRFMLPAPYAPFLENLTVGILPKHLWQNISASGFALAVYNLEPVGTGPFRFNNIQKNKLGSISSLSLETRTDYYGKKPYLTQINFQFFEGEEELLNAYNRKQIDGMSFVSAKKQDKINQNSETSIYSLNLPRYYAIFFNQTSSKSLSDKNVRLAFQYATDRNEILKEVLLGNGSTIDSPVPGEIFGLAEEHKKYDFSEEKAKEILEKGGWKDLNKDGILEKKIADDKEPTALEITITTTQWPELAQTAEIIKKQWEKIGAKINIEILDINDIQQNKILPRNYQAILFGEILGEEPDPFSFWHSSQKKYPGLNLAIYDNKEADKLLEDARQILDQQERFKKYETFQNIIIEDSPAVFLYSPTYLYAINKKMKGIEVKNIATPSQRLVGIENWYIQTKRIFGNEK